MQEKVIMIVGPAQHGKDTLANAIADITGTPVQATSDLIYKEMADEIAQYVAASTFERSEQLGNDKLKYPDLKFIDAHTEWLSGRILEFLKALPKDNKDDQTQEIRRHLAVLGSYRCIHDPIYWTRRLIKAGARVIPGIRRMPEIVSAVDYIKSLGMQPVTVWIERPHGPEVANDNLEISPESWEFGTLVEVDEGAHDRVKVAALGVLAGEKHIALKKEI